MEILTDIALRAHWFRSHEKAYHVSKDTMLTPAARDFIREHGITLIYEDSALEGQPEVEVSSVPESVKAVNQLPKKAAESADEHYKAMPMAAVPQGADHKPQYVNGETGEVLSVKPENMTHLHGNVLVPKTHPQIAFRGMLDSLEAKIMSLQVVASENGLHRLTDALDEVLAYEVDQIKVVEPDNISDIFIEDGKDYVTLVTCTPYGINSHRLLVRGTRVPYVETEKEQQVSRQEESTWNQEYLHAIIVGVEWTAVGIGAVLVLTGLYRLLFKSKKGGGKA